MGTKCLVVCREARTYLIGQLFVGSVPEGFRCIPNYSDKCYWRRQYGPYEEADNDQDGYLSKKFHFLGFLD